MRFLVRLVPLGWGRAAFLAAVRSVAANLGASAVNPKWTSYGALEIDVFAPSREDFRVVMAALEPLCGVEFTTDLQAPPRFVPRDDAVREAVSLFDAERFWEAHEVLEAQWRASEGDEKRLLQGLILVCAALVHHQKGEEKVALGIVQRALPLLAWEGGMYHRIDVPALGERLSRELGTGSLSLFEI
ncbi:MAG: DUF309 domain-containing protein [Nitrososphaerales archaeon]|jgi:hypothetical protein